MTESFLPSLAQRFSRPLRLAIHPMDTYEPTLVAETLGVLGTAVDSGCDVGSCQSYLEAPA